jgi:hypothetical protein
MENFQKLTYGDLPLNFAAQIFVSMMDATQFSLSLFGAHYGPFSSYNQTVQPFLDIFPGSPVQTLVVQGDWLTALNASAFGVGALNTSSQPEVRDSFYAKSIMTPEAEPLTTEAINATFEYLAAKGGNTSVVSPIHFCCVTLFIYVRIDMGHRDGAVGR